MSTTVADADFPSPRLAVGDQRSQRSPGRCAAAGSHGDRRWRRIRAMSSPPMSARRTPAPSRTARRRCTSRSRRAASVRATRSSPSAIRSSPPRTRSATATRRRCSSTSTRRRCNIDPSLVEAGDHARGRAPCSSVHQIGCRATSEAVVALRARAAGCAVIEDAACAIGIRAASFRASGSASASRTATWRASRSTPRKIVTTGDGGMIRRQHCPEWDARFRLWRQHGMSVPDTVRHSSNDVVFETCRSGRLQLPPDRSPGRGRPASSAATAGRGCASAAAIAARYHAALEHDSRAAAAAAAPCGRATQLARATASALPDRCDQRASHAVAAEPGHRQQARGVMNAHRTPSLRRRQRASGGSLREARRAEDQHASCRCLFRAVGVGSEPDRRGAPRRVPLMPRVSFYRPLSPAGAMLARLRQSRSCRRRSRTSRS